MRIRGVLAVVTVITYFGIVWAQEEPKKEEVLVKREVKCENVCLQEEPQEKLKEEPKEELKEPKKSKEEIVNVSWYGAGFHGRRMANGRTFNMNDPTVVAHRSLPFGTRVRLTRLDEDKKSIDVIVQDRGPYVREREFDVSREAARNLGMIEEGVVKCRVEVEIKEAEKKASAVK